MNQTPKKKNKNETKAAKEREVMVDIMYINDLSTERRKSFKSSVRNGSFRNGVATAHVNYHQETDLLSSHKKANGQHRFSAQKSKMTP